MARQEDGTVMLRATKHLEALRDRPFAALRVTREPCHAEHIRVRITHIVTPGGSAHRSPPRAVYRPLVAAHPSMPGYDVLALTR